MDVATTGSKPPDLVELDSPAHAILIARTLRKSYVHGTDYCVSRSSGGRLLGGFIYNHYTKRAVAAHVCGFGPNWLSRALLYWAFFYPFEMLRVGKVLAIAPSSNPSYAFAQRLGFKEEAELHDVVPSGAMMILSMDRDACRWLGERPRNRALIVHSGVSDVFRR